MKKIIYHVIIIALLFLNFSCKKWLQVTPEDKFTEEQVFSNETGFRDALNGAYLRMNYDASYGRQLTLSTVDILANRFMVGSGTTLNGQLSNWEYGQSDVKNRLAPIWTTAYTTIGNINYLLKATETYGSNISPDLKQWIRGEALGLRAYIHFDLLRLFGPVYTLQNQAKIAIPYYVELSPKIQDFLPANQVIDSLLKDVNESIALLAIDNSAEVGASNYNNIVFNEVAALGLKARILQWKGDKEGAFVVAKEAISKAQNFKWVQQSKVSDVENPDRIFYSEILFGIYNSSLYDSYNSLYYYELSNDNILGSGGSAYLDNIFENITTDYRYGYSWKVPPVGQSYPTFFKYADIKVKNKPEDNPQRFVIPLLRKSELYYIAAESAPSPEEGLSYLNTVRNARGISSLSSAANLSNEILKEYRKEFFGEGQLWYYYKRNQITQIISPNISTLKTVPNSAWEIPVPEEEFMTR